MNKTDEIPLDVIQAAARLKAWFRNRGVDEWIFDGVCSQSFATRAFDAEASFAKWRKYEDAFIQRELGDSH